MFSNLGGSPSKRSKKEPLDDDCLKCTLPESAPKKHKKNDSKHSKGSKNSINM